jgi:organic hydroperoxide reductase OsmC/OhrA
VNGYIRPTMPASRTFTYDVALAWDGGRASTVTAGERPAIHVAPPEDFPYGDAAAWSPEHLFLGSLSSCTLLAFLAHAANGEIDVESYTAEVSGTITRRKSDGRYAFVEVVLSPRVVVGAGQAEAARELTSKAERDSYISAGTTADIDVRWEITER